MKTFNKALIGASVFALSLAGASAHAQTLDIQSVSAVGTSSAHPAKNAIDGNEATRWRGNSTNPQEHIILDMGSLQTVENVRIDWWRGRVRTYNFEIAYRTGTSGDWNTIDSYTADRNDDLQDYDIPDVDARQIRILSNRTSTTEISRIELIGTAAPSAPEPEPTPPPTSSNNGVSVPARIEAENFINFNDADTRNRGGAFRDTAVDIQSCRDEGCGFNVGWTAGGEWLEYEIDVTNPGDYEANLRLAQRRNGAVMSIEVDGQNRTGNIPIDSTGAWQSYYTETVSLGNLTPGSHTVRVNFENGGVNFNWIELEGGGGVFGLDPNLEPWENFDLDDWALDSPEGRSSNPCQSRRVNEDEWNEVPGTPTHDYIFTHTDGGMRFVSPIGGSTTNPSCNEGFPRSELREMLRRGNTSISTTGVNPNNWALGYQPSGGNYGGRNGELKATLRVNRVTTTGEGLHPGRTIIGQIHAEDDEPLRLYYRKLPNAEFGCIYAESEIRNGDDVSFNMIGDEQCDDNNGNGPSDGIVLDELFSYEIENVNEEIRVRIIRGDQDGEVLSEVTIDLDALDSGYDRSDEWMYFKAGAYTQNNTGNDNDTDVITFYRLSNTHDNN